MFAQCLTSLQTFCVLHPLESPLPLQVAARGVRSFAQYCSHMHCSCILGLTPHLLELLLAVLRKPAPSCRCVSGGGSEHKSVAACGQAKTSVVHSLHVQEDKTDVVLHFGMHGTVEWLPGSPLGNNGLSWSDVLMGWVAVQFWSPGVLQFACF